MKKYHFILILFCAMHLCNAQDSLNSALVDRETYRLYTEKNWKDLCRKGNEYIAKGYDYYYLRMRLGIAYYEQKNYSLAKKHFEKALSFNSRDTLAQEYLYYTHVFTGRSEDARWLSRKFPKDLADRTGIKPDQAVTEIFAEGGSKFTDSSAYYDSHRGEKSNYYNPSSYLHFGLNHFVQNRVSLFHAVTFYSQTNFTGDVRQAQYYLKGAMPFKRDWLAIGSVHLVNLHFTSQIPANTQPPPMSGMPPPHRQQTTLSVSNYIVLSAAAKKVFGQVHTALGFSYSNVYGQELLVHYGSVAWYVFGNSKIVAGATAYMHTANSYSSLNFAYAPFVYYQPCDKFFMKASYFGNTKNNIVEDNGYIVNNSPDLTTSRISLQMNYRLTKKLSLYTVLQREYKTEKVQLFHYNYNVVIGGVRFYL